MFPELVQKSGLNRWWALWTGNGNSTCIFLCIFLTGHITVAIPDSVDYLCRGWLHTFKSMSDVCCCFFFLRECICPKLLLDIKYSYFTLSSLHFLSVLFSHLFSLFPWNCCPVTLVHTSGGKEIKPSCFLFSDCSKKKKHTKNRTTVLLTRGHELRSPSLCHINYRTDWILGLHHNGKVVLL